MSKQKGTQEAKKITKSLKTQSDKEEEKNRLNIFKKVEIPKDDVFKLEKDVKELLDNGLEMGSIWDYANSDSNDKTTVQINDVIYGRYYGKSHYKKGSIDNYLISLLTIDGQINIWSSFVLESKFKELDINYGDTIAIKYLGEKPSSRYKKKKYHSFAVSKLR